MTNYSLYKRSGIAAISKTIHTPWGILIPGRYQGLLKLTLERGYQC